MIGQLRGDLLEKQAPFLMIDVQGVGYELQAPMTTFYVLPEVGEAITLHTHLSVSETAQTLFGFAERRERDLFRILIKVNGVGPKMAVAILSGMEANDLVDCVRDDKVSVLVKVPGVGKKTAERLIIELRDKLSSWRASSDDLFCEAKEIASSEAPVQNVREESESALLALGYKPAEAGRLVTNAFKLQPDASAENIIRLSLRSMASG